MSGEDKSKTPTRDEIVEMVFASNVLGRSANQKNLFKYLMQHDPSIVPSEYEIADIVFNRGGDFDPAIDSVVRTEIYRLRRNLERFNAGSNSLIVEIPPRTFLPVIRTIATTNKSKFKFWMLGSTATVFAVILAVLLAWNINSTNNDEMGSTTAIDETFRQKISVVIANKFDDEFTDHLLNQLLTQFSHDISTHNTVWLVRPEDSDYRMEFRSEKIAPDTDAEIFIFVYSTAGDLVYSKPYKLPADHSNLAIREFSQILFVETFDLSSSVVRYHATNPDIAETRRYLYQCALDTLTFTIIDAPNYLGPNFLDCLGPSLTNLPNDKGFIYTLQADVYSHIALNNLGIAVDRPLEEARSALKLAHTNGYSQPYYFTMKIRLEMLNTPIDHNELREAIDSYYGLYPNNATALYVVAEIESKYFGNWERARQLSLRATKGMSETANLSQIVLFNYAVMKEDWEEAEKRYQLTQKNTGISTLIPVTHLACNTGNQKLISELQEQLSGYGINNWDEMVVYVKSRQYHNTYENSLIDDSVMKSCGLF